MTVLVRELVLSEVCIRAALKTCGIQETVLQPANTSVSIFERVNKTENCEHFFGLIRVFRSTPL